MKKNRTSLFDIPVEQLTGVQADSELTELAEAYCLSRPFGIHQQGRSGILSDAEGDALRQRNAAIESRFPHLVLPDSPSKRVGGEPATGFEKARHTTPMLSLDNAFTEGDMAGFLSGIRNFIRELRDPKAPIELLAEIKLDGLSCSLRYEKGRLVRGATRGNGVEGEDVTRTV